MKRVALEAWLPNWAEFVSWYYWQSEYLLSIYNLRPTVFAWCLKSRKVNFVNILLLFAMLWKCKSKFSFSLKYSFAFLSSNPLEYDTCNVRIVEWTNFNLWNTVKLGYNEFGYNEHPVITNKKLNPKYRFYYIKPPGFNEQIWSVPSSSL